MEEAKTVTFDQQIPLRPRRVKTNISSAKVEEQKFSEMIIEQGSEPSDFDSDNQSVSAASKSIHQEVDQKTIRESESSLSQISSLV